MAEYSKMAHGLVTSTGGAMPIYLSFTPDFVQVWNLSNGATPASSVFFSEVWNKFMSNGDGVCEVFTSDISNPLTASSAYPNGITPISAALALNMEAQIQVASITKASPAVVTTGSNHNYSTGDVVLFEGLYQSSSTGMIQICGMPFMVTVTGATTFTIDWNTNQSNYTALSASPAGAYVRRLSFPFLYAPGVAFIESMTFGSTTTIVTTAQNNFVVGQEIGFRIPPQWGASGLNSSNNPFVPSSPRYGFITSISNSTTFVVDINTINVSAFNTNVPFASTPGLSFPQVFAVGDLNTGGVAYSGGNLYPSPIVNGVSTINGPAISGSFVNNARNGFVMGSDIMGTNGQFVYWQAYYSDYSNGFQIAPL